MSTGRVRAAAAPCRRVWGHLRTKESGGPASYLPQATRTDAETGLKRGTLKGLRALSQKQPAGLWHLPSGFFRRNSFIFCSKINGSLMHLQLFHSCFCH